MVAGGAESTILDSTEVYQDNEWRTVSGKLPRAMYDMKAATINERILLFGIYYFMSEMFFIFQTLGGSYSYSNNILEYNPGTETWQEIGTSKEARWNHAVSIVSYMDYAGWCE